MPEFDTLGATNDTPTTTDEGQPLRPLIDGVLIRSRTTHVDHRGRLFEVVNPAADPDFWAEPVVHSYVFTIRRDSLKGWGVHEEKADRYCLIHGETMTVLYDDRPGSPTRGMVQEVPLTAQGIQMVYIPPGVWHLSVNLAPHETLLLNCPTKPYVYSAPDRWTLPWDSERIPVDVRGYFPRQMRP